MVAQEKHKFQSESKKCDLCDRITKHEWYGEKRTTEQSRIDSYKANSEVQLVVRDLKRRLSQVDK